MSLATLVTRLDPLPPLHSGIRPTGLRTGARSARPAGVLALLSGSGDPELLFTERAASLRSQPGQVSFPGGALDDDDTDVVAAALRETHEEIGLSAPMVTVLGALPGVRPTVTRHEVTAVVGTWSGREPLVLAPDEVAAVHRFPVSELSDPKHRVTARHPRGGSGPAFWVDEVMIWGFTAWLTDDLLSLGGWQQPWDQTRIVDVPLRFRQ